MRYFLRNQDKIKDQLGEEILQRIIDSLDHHFKMKMVIRTDRDPDDRYDTLIISDYGHTVNDIAFYVIEIKGHWYRLAFKEFIG